MSRFKFVHASHLRLDSPFDGVASASPALQEALQEASLNAFDKLIDFTIEKHAKFLLITGDICPTPLALRAQKRLLLGLQKLSDEHIHTILALGPNDRPDQWPVINEWPGGVSVLNKKLRSVVVKVDGEVAATINAAGPALDQDPMIALADIIDRGGQGVLIGILPPGTNLEKLPIDKMKTSAVSYWAHGYQQETKQIQDANVRILSPGTHQARGLGENGPKGAFLIDVKDDGSLEPVFHDLDLVRVATIELDIQNHEDSSSIIHTATAEAGRLLREAADKVFLLCPVLTGTSKLHFDLQNGAALDALNQGFRESFSDESARVSWQPVEDRTVSPLKDIEIVKRNDFSSQLTWAAKFFKNNPEKLPAFIAKNSKELASPIIKRLLTEQTAAEQQTSLAKALSLCLALLEGGK